MRVRTAAGCVLRWLPPFMRSAARCLTAVVVIVAVRTIAGHT